MLDATAPEPRLLTLREVEDDYIKHILRMSNDNLSLAARRLGIYRSTLKRRLRKM